MLLLGYGIQRTLRVWHCLLQTHVFQCHTEFNENVDINCPGSDWTVRMYQTIDCFDIAKPCQVFHGVVIFTVDIFTLLCMVGVYELL